MSKDNKKVALSSGNLKYKLRIAFCLMSVLPLLVSVYLVSNYLLPRAGFKLDLTVAVSIAVSIIIAVIGFFVVKEVFDRIVTVSSEAKLIAQGDLSRIVEVGREDEVGFIGESLNQLTTQIRSSMDELKGYSERTTEINVEIQKRVLALSSLLQISSLISQGLKLDEVLKLTIEKSRVLANSDTSFLLFREVEDGAFEMKTVDGVNAQYLAKIKIEKGDPIFNKFVKSSRAMILDKDNDLPESLSAAFYEKLRLKNILALPVFLRGKVAGVLGIGNTREDFGYKKEEIELLDIFAKQISIAFENDLLMRWVEKLEIKDSLTGLFNDAFIRNRLQEEIKRAIVYQRPCSLILLNVDDFEKFHAAFGSLQAESALKKIAMLIKDSITEIDRAARTGDNEFAIVLPEKNKRNAQNIAEDIRKKIEFVFNEESDTKRKLTLSGGVTENPLDGMTQEELFNKAKQLLDRAKNEGKNKILI